MNSNKPPWGLIREWGLICQNGFWGGGLFGSGGGGGGLFGSGGLFDHLRYRKIPDNHSGHLYNFNNLEMAN